MRPSNLPLPTSLIEGYYDGALQPTRHKIITTNYALIMLFIHITPMTMLPSTCLIQKGLSRSDSFDSRTFTFASYIICFLLVPCRARSSTPLNVFTNGQLLSALPNPREPNRRNEPTSQSDLGAGNEDNLVIHRNEVIVMLSIVDHTKV